MADTNMNDTSDEVARQTDMAGHLSFHDTPMVEVVVGGTDEPERTFHIHAGVLIKNSEFFKAALQPHFAEGEQLKVQLREESVEEFSSFARWVYNRSDLNHGDYLHHAKVYVLADRLIAPALKVDIVRAFRDEIDEELDALNSVMFMTGQGSDGRNLARPLEMYEVVQIARLVYEGTSQSDDDMRSLLSVYVAVRMHRRKPCRRCQNQQDLLVGIWDDSSIRELLDCGLDDFIFDVMVTIPEVCSK